MNYLQAIIMGIVQGAAEFLPISSSGHLAIFAKILSAFDSEAAKFFSKPDLTFDIMLHLGTLLAIFFVYWKDIKKLILEGFGILGDFFLNAVIFFRNIFSREEAYKYRKVVNSSYRKFVMLVIVSTIPTGIIGVLGDSIIEEAKTNLLIVGVCLFITSCLLLISDFVEDGYKKPKNITYTNAFVIGICQGFATLPGISRSGTTITACLVSKFDRKLAVKYSFIMSIPAVLGAAVLKLKDFFATIGDCKYLGQYIVGTLVSAVVGFICMKLLLVLVRNNKFKYFAYYCIFAGIASIILEFVIK